ncbi:hypothetical protein WN48_02936 [Eufriesea mexicana]|nr:hypothetical protein WN48_02936 [Eufriesea mexicana]
MNNALTRATMLQDHPKRKHTPNSQRIEIHLGSALNIRLAHESRCHILELIMQKLRTAATPRGPSRTLTPGWPSGGIKSRIYSVSVPGVFLRPYDESLGARPHRGSDRKRSLKTEAATVVTHLENPSPERATATQRNDLEPQCGPLIWPIATAEFGTLIYHDARGHYPEFASLGEVKQAANGNGPDILAPMIRAVVQSRLLTNNYRAKSDPYSTSGFADDRLDVGLASLLPNVERHVKVVAKRVEDGEKGISEKFLEPLCDVSFENPAMSRRDSVIRMEVETKQCNMSFDREKRVHETSRGSCTIFTLSHDSDKLDPNRSQGFPNEPSKFNPFILPETSLPSLQVPPERRAP